jgi:4'-phosphopantetheinyl transferase
MIKVYYAKIDDEWSEDELKEKISCLPTRMVEQAMKHKNWQDRQLSIAGKLLLLNVLKDFKLSHKLQLKDIRYNEFERPYFNDTFDFNISHSQNVAVCAATTEGKTGIDVEKIQPIIIEDFNDYFTLEEIEVINKSSNKNLSFYKTWTKKEAFIKAVGKGLNIELSSISTVDDSIEYEGALYYLHEVFIDDEYASYVCSTAKEDAITATKILL